MVLGTIWPCVEKWGEGSKHDCYLTNQYSDILQNRFTLNDKHY